jgi:hypothetical protein
MLGGRILLLSFGVPAESSEMALLCLGLSLFRALVHFGQKRATIKEGPFPSQMNA